MKRFSGFFFGLIGYLLAALFAWQLCAGQGRYITYWPALGVTLVLACRYGWSALAGTTLAAFVFFVLTTAGPLALAPGFALGQGLAGALLYWGYKRLSLSEEEGSPGYWGATVAIAAPAAILSGLSLLPMLTRTPHLGFTPQWVLFSLSSFAGVFPLLGLKVYLPGYFRRKTTDQLMYQGCAFLVIVLIAFGMAKDLPVYSLFLEDCIGLVMVGALLLDGPPFSALLLLIGALAGFKGGQLSAADWTAVNVMGRHFPLSLLTVVGFMVVSFKNRIFSLSGQLKSKILDTRAILAALPDIVMILDRDGNCLGKLSGTHPLSSALNAVPDKLHDLPDPSYVKQRLAQIQRTLETQAMQTEVLHFKKDAIDSYIEARMVPYQNGSCLTILRDRTEEYRMQQALIDSEMRSRSVIEAIPDPLMILDGSGRYTRVLNDRRAVPFQDMAEVVGQTVYDLYPRDKADERVALLRQVLETQQPLVQDFAFELAGTKGWYELRMVPYEDNQVLTLIHDVTEDRLSRLALEKSEARSRAVLQAIPDPLQLHSYEGVYLEALNNHFTPYLKDRQMLGRTVQEVMPDSEMAQARLAGIRKAIDTQELVVHDLYGEIDGQPHWFELRIVPYEGRLALTLVREVTEDRLAQRALQQSEARSRSVLEAIPDPLILTDSNGIYLEVLNGRYPPLIKGPGDLGKSMFEILPAARAKERLEHTQQAIRLQQPVTHLFHLQIGGQDIWQELRVVPCGQDKALTLVRDVTEDHLKQLALEQSEAFNRSIMGAIPHMTILQKADGMVQQVVVKGRADLYLPEASYLQKPLEDYLLPDVVQTVRQEIAQVLTHREQRSTSIRTVLFGQEIWVELYISPYKADTVLTLVRDVTQEKQAQSEAQEKGRMLSLISDKMTDVVSLRDRNRNPVYVSPSLERMLGYTREELAKIPHGSVVHPEDEPVFQHAYKEAQEGGRAPAERVEVRYRTKAGHYIWLEVEIQPIKDDIGRVTHVLTVSRNITERRRYEERLQLANTAVNGVREGFMVTTAEGEITWVNRAFTEITGYTEADALGQMENELLRTQFTPMQRLQHRTEALSVYGAWQGELISRRKNGTSFPELRSISLIRDADGTPLYQVSLLTDLSAEREVEETIWRLSTHDPVTRLPNVTFFRETLEYARKRARRNDTRFAVMKLGFNRIESIYESIGHAAGDAVLTELASRVTDLLRESDTVARLGRDRLGLLFEGITDMAEISALATRVLSIFDLPIRLGDENIYLSGNVGISIFPDDAEEVDDLLKHSVAALRKATSHGELVYRFYSEQMALKEHERFRLESALRNALETGKELSVRYQPKVSLETGHIVGFEALAYWESPVLGVVPADTFIPIAENAGLINALGQWVLGQVSRHLHYWRDAGLPVQPVAVNLSAKQLRDVLLVPQIVAQLQAHDLPPQLLTLEITESVAMDDVASTQAVLKQIKEHGLGLALDDFGKGHSSLSVIRRLPLDVLKIDRSFIEGLETSQESRAICRAALQMAQALGLETVAEGVETEAQRNFLRDLGCDAYQGYLFAKPVWFEAVMAMLTQHVN